jgi:signal transduction histidine kinase
MAAGSATGRSPRRKDQSSDELPVILASDLRDVSVFDHGPVTSIPAPSLPVVHRTRSLFSESAAGVAHSLTGALLTWVYLMILFVFFPTALSLVVVWVGIPMLVATFALVRGCASAERRLAVRLFATDIPPPPRVTEMEEGRGGQFRAVLTHGASWRGLSYLAIRWVTGLIAFVLCVAFGGVAGGLMAAPFIDRPIDIDGWESKGGADLWWMPLVGLLLALIAWVLLAALGQLHRFVAPLLLGPSSKDEIRRLQGRAARLDAQTQLARELHDSVGHTMTSVVVQAGAARRVFDANPLFAKEALQEIEQSARQALDELDYMIGVLRNDQGVPTKSPLPTLLDVDRLVVTGRRNGVKLTHRIEGDVAAVPASVSREAYRIIQEGLTNVTRHAPGVPGELTVTIGVQQIEIVVTNPVVGEGDQTRASGRGLLGVSERVQALGGVMWSGPIDGVYVLRAILPFQPGAA